MSNNFMSAMKNTLNDEYNVSVTEKRRCWLPYLR
mgnify:CR=1 FL=1